MWPSESIALIDDIEDLLRADLRLQPAGAARRSPDGVHPATAAAAIRCVAYNTVREAASTRFPGVTPSVACRSPAGAGAPSAPPHEHWRGGALPPRSILAAESFRALAAQRVDGEPARFARLCAGCYAQHNTLRRCDEAVPIRDNAMRPPLTSVTPHRRHEAKRRARSSAISHPLHLKLDSWRPCAPPRPCRHLDGHDIRLAHRPRAPVACRAGCRAADERRLRGGIGDAVGLDCDGGDARPSRRGRSERLDRAAAHRLEQSDWFCGAGRGRCRERIVRRPGVRDTERRRPRRRLAPSSVVQQRRWIRLAAAHQRRRSPDEQQRRLSAARSGHTCRADRGPERPCRGRRQGGRQRRRQRLFRRLELQW